METRKALIAALAAMRAEADAFEQWIDAPHRVGSRDYDRWGPKDLVAHAAEWTRRLVSQLQGSKDPDADGTHGGDLNRTLFDRHHETAWEEIVSLLGSNLAIAEQEAAGRTDDQLNETGPGERARPAWWAIAFYGIVHNLTHIGQALIRSGRGDKAVELQERMTPLLLAIDEYELWQAVVGYNLGRIYVLTGRTDAAMEQISAAIDIVPGVADWVAGDEDFTEVRDAVLRGRA